MQQSQQIRNTENSLNAQLRTLALLESSLEAGLIDIAQVDQFRQNIETERANLLQSRNALQTELDRFKSSTLGLPPDLELALDDSLIQPFQLISPQISDVQNAVDDFIDEFGQQPKEPPLETLAQAVSQLTELRPRVADEFATVDADLQQLEQVTPQRTELMTATESKLFAGDRQRLSESLQSLRQRFDATAETLEQIETALDESKRAQSADAIVA
ncbi:unnamed protein product, partial [marine sediment metagenome]